MTSALAFVLALATPVALGAECTSRRGPSGGPVDWDAVYAELALSPPERLDFRVGGQVVVLHASTVPREYEDQLRDVIENIADTLAALGVELGTREARPVHVLASLQNHLLPTATAFTWCGYGDEPYAYYADGSVVPGTVCLIVVFPERLEAGGSESMAFTMAHEWMHTFQFGAHPSVGRHTLWWADGSADWFGHKVVDGHERRAPAIEAFYEWQPRCTLQQITYPSQVFFFWAEQVFGVRWVMELALGDGASLSSLAGIAGIMAPEHWRAWSMALADDTIRYPDGRPLPTPPEPETLRLRPQCPLRIEGPPLSVQLRRIDLAEAGRGGGVQVDTGGAIVSLRWPDGRWQLLRRERTLVDPGRWDSFTVAAISAGDQRLDVRIGAGGLGEDCACHIGEWMELEREGGRLFRLEPEGNPGLAMAGYEMEITYVNEGPVLTFNADHTYTLDDAFQQRYSAAGETFWQLSLDRNRDAGRWRIDDGGGRLILARTSTSERGSLNAAGVASPWTSHHDLPGREVPHEFHCEGDRLELSWIGREAARTYDVEGGPPVAVFRRVAPGR